MRVGLSGDCRGISGDVAAAVRILVVEDDSAISDVVCRRLGREGFSVEPAFSGTEAKRLLQVEHFDLVVTDLMLPGMTGEEVVALVRKAHGSLSVIVISARSTAADKVDLLSLGADDYLTKPFDLDELIARVKVQLRHRSGPMAAAALPGDGVITQGMLVINRHERSAACNGASLSLTRTEFDMLELLAAHPKRVFTKQELYERVWGEQFMGQDNSVSVHVSNLRAKLKPCGADGYIQTVWGMGFKFETPQ